MKYLASFSMLAGLAFLALAGNAYATPVPVPEPASLSLLAIGFGGAVAAKFLRRRK